MVQVFALAAMALVAGIPSHALAAKAGAKVVETVTPVQKVIQMMEELKAKAIKEKEEESVAYTAYVQFCKSTDASKTDAIAEASDSMDKLKSDIESLDSDASTLAEEVSKLDASIDTATQELAKAQRERDEQKADYTATRASLDESIGEMDEAIARLTTMMEGVSGAAAASLVQTLASKPKLPVSARRALTAFLATSSHADAAAAAAAPEGATYESQSGGITSVVEDMKKKFGEERDKLDRDEMEQSGAFQVVKQMLTDQIDQHTSMRQMKATEMKDKETSSATASSDLADTTASHDEDVKYLSNLRVECEQKAVDFEARQKLRAEELEAIQKAMDIIKDGAVSGSAAKHLPSLAQRVGSSFAQLRASVQDTAVRQQEKAASFLAVQGRKLGSRALAAVAGHAAFDPFVKVRKMITDMIQKLEEEGAAAAEHKAWCDEELGTNKATRDEKTRSVEELTATVEQQTASAAKLAEDIATLTAELAELDTAVSEATNLRQAEKSKNTQTVKEAEEAVMAVQRALSVLQDFYAKAASATSLTQFRQTPPATFDKPYKGQGAEGGILGMLEVILSDFERLLVETTQAEAAAEAEYAKFSADSKESTDTKDRSKRHKTDEKMYLEVDLAESKKELASVQKELDAAGKYFEELKPACLEEGVSYEERVARREEEIQSLKEALRILSGEA